MTLGQRIQSLRKGLGLSQEALGELLGVSRQAISKWESDLTVPELDKLVALSKLFSLPVGRLLGVEEGPGTEPPAASSPSLPPWARRLIAALTLVCLAFAATAGVLWSQNAALRRTSRIRTLQVFTHASCQVQRQENGDAVFTLELTADREFQSLLSGWQLHVSISDCRDRERHIVLLPQEELWENENWVETAGVQGTSLGWGRYTAALTVPDYSGVPVYVRAVLSRRSGQASAVQDIFRIWGLEGQWQDALWQTAQGTVMG